MSFGEKKVNWAANSISPESKLRAELQSSREDAERLAEALKLASERMKSASKAVTHPRVSDNLALWASEAKETLAAHEAKEK